MKTINYLLFSLFLLVSCKKSETMPVAEKSNKKEIDNIQIEGISDISITFNSSTNTYSISVPSGTDIKSLKLSFKLPNGAKSNPDISSYQDFTKSVKYIVSAEDGSTIVYTFIVIPKPVTTLAFLESFTFEDILPKVEGIIDNINNKVYLIGFKDISITSLKPTIKVTDGSTVSPASGVSQDFSKPIIYKLIAGNGNLKETEVLVTKTNINSNTKRTLYFSGTGVQAINALSGEIIWQYKIDYPLSSPVFGKGNIYVGSRDKKIIALKADNGQKLWEFLATDEIDNDKNPTYGDGQIYFSTSIFVGNVSNESYFYALDADTGQKKWEYKFKGSLRGNPLYFDNKVIFSALNIGIICLNSKNGQLLWIGKGADEFIGASSLTDNSYDLFYTGKYLVHGNEFLDINTGKRYDINVGVSGFFDNKNNVSRNCVVEGNILYINNSQGEVLAFDLIKQESKWKIKVPSISPRLNFDLLINDGTIYTFDSKSIYAINAIDGSIKWRSPEVSIKNVGASLGLGYFVIAGEIIYLRNANSLNGFDIHTGRPIVNSVSKIDMPIEGSCPIVLENGSLIGIYPASSGCKN